MKLVNTFLLLLLTCSFCLAQQTKAFEIKGKVKTQLTINEDQLKNYKVQTIGTVNISNHKGEVKGIAKDMKGVLLSDVLKNIDLDEDNPKLFSEYYFVCVASDNYKVVYSWNELFNTKVADKIFIVTEKEGKTMFNNDDGILMISADDAKTGRRYVKNLASIQVRRAE